MEDDNKVNEAAYRSDDNIVDIEIEKNVPIEPTSRGGLRFPIEKMEIGDSFTVDCSEGSNFKKHSVMGALRKYKLRQENVGVLVTFVTRISKDGILRIWLTQRAKVEIDK